MADTKHPVREDVKGFLAMLEQMGQPGIEETGHEAGREAMRAMKALAEEPPRELAVQRDLTCPGPAGDIELRLYDTREGRGPGPVVVFFHGGGFVIGDVGVYDSVCSEIAHQLDRPVVSVEYRLAPEHPFPAAPDDCEAAARWIASSPAELGLEVTGIVPMGDSAGGNLAIVTTNQLVADPAAAPVIVQAPIYPVTDDISEHQSLKDFGDGFLLTGPGMAFFTQSYAGDPADPRHTPMVADCANTPPTVLCTAGLDPLRDSGRNYAAHLIQQGSEVSYFEFPGIIHGFITLRKALPSGQADLAAYLAAVKAKIDAHPPEAEARAA